VEVKSIAYNNSEKVGRSKNQKQISSTRVKHATTDVKLYPKTNLGIFDRSIFLLWANVVCFVIPFGPN
jgi:hypothetical protein